MRRRHVSLVTGAARGIGSAIAEALAKRGDLIVAADLLFADGKVSESVSAMLGAEGLILPVDITNTEQVNGLVAKAVERLGRIDCLVNSVGIARPEAVQEMATDDWQATIEVNLNGAFLLSRAVARVMIPQHYGRIIHIGSTASHTSAAGLSAYSASKHGLIGLVRGMACDLSQHGITVNAVCPGNCETEMLDAVIAKRAELQGRTPDEVRQDMIRKTPAGRLGRPTDTAAAVLFFSSEDAEYVTGQMLTVDGGRSLNLV
jgi:3-oxoacyl-[acyl-carrier protein] reductase